MIRRLWEVISDTETVAVRFFFSIMSLGYAAFLPQVDGHFEYAIAIDWASPWLWSVGFTVYGLSVMYGVITKRYNLLLLVLEGGLGSFIWLLLGIATSMSQGMIGPTFFGALVAAWLLIRYPSWK